MKRLTQTMPLLLAAALQILPLLRNLVTSPAASSTFAFILRWGIGSTAVIGSVDAVSGASPSFTSTTNFTGTTSQYFSNSIVVSLVGSGNPATTSDGFTLTNLLNTADHATNFLSNGKFTTNAMPPGLTFTCISLSGANYIYGSVTGTPAISGTYYIHVTCVSPNNGSIATNVFFTFSGAAATPPTITTQPVVGATNFVGTTNNLFNVVAGGTAPLGYQWYFNTNTAVLNQTNATLTLTNLQLTNAGYYRCTITNSAGGTNSANALLTVWQPPVITNQPVGLTNLVSSNATFSVVAGGTAPLSYQWYFNTNTLLTGQTAATLTLTNLQLTNAGTYSIVVTNVAGAVTSSPALLGVWQPPVITNQPVGLTNLVSSNVTFSVTVGGTALLSYQWYFNTNTALLNATNTSLSLTNIQLTNAGTYSVVVTNVAGAVTSSPALLGVWQPPVITSQPASTTNTAGQTVNFSVTAGGTAPLSYKWFFNTNAAVPNATNATLSLTNARLSQAGTYSVVITNVAGGVTSSPAILGIKLPTVSAIAAPTATNGYFQFIFTPVVGLTNSVLTNSTLTTGTWAVLTNVPPPATAAPVTVTDKSSSAGRYYRVQVIP